LFRAIPEWPERFDTQYDCLMFGYEESLKKMKEIGREQMLINITCLLSFIALLRILFDIVAKMCKQHNFSPLIPLSFFPL
jgi:hypothetical protein